MKEDILTIDDIARIDGDYPRLDKIRDIEIAENIYSDGFIDRKELGLLLMRSVDDILFIYGNAVRIFRRNKLAESLEGSFEEEVLVKKGDRVSLVVRKGGVSIELIGMVMNDGRKGEEIIVRLKDYNGKRSSLVKGRVMRRGLIEVVL